LLLVMHYGLAFRTVILKFKMTCICMYIMRVNSEKKQHFLMLLSIVVAGHVCRAAYYCILQIFITLMVLNLWVQTPDEVAESSLRGREGFRKVRKNMFFKQK